MERLTLQQRQFIINSNSVFEKLRFEKKKFFDRMMVRNIGSMYNALMPNRLLFFMRGLDNSN